MSCGSVCWNASFLSRMSVFVVLCTNSREGGVFGQTPVRTTLVTPVALHDKSKVCALSLDSLL